MTSIQRSLRLSGIFVAILWLVAIIVTDGLEHGTTGNAIDNVGTAEQTILGHQAIIVLEAISSCWLAGLLIVFAAAVRQALGDAASTMATIGGAVLSGAAIVMGAAISFAELAAAHHHDTTALSTLGYLAAFSFAWKGVAWGIFLLAAGWAMLATGAAPRWFAVITLVLGVLAGLAMGAIVFWALAPVWFIGAGFLVSSPRPLAKDPAAVTETAVPI